MRKRRIKNIEFAMSAKNRELMNFYDLLDVQALAVDYMFNAIDANDVLSFGECFKLWKDTTKQILSNPFNECGHALCDEIKQFASRHGIA